MSMNTQDDDENEPDDEAMARRLARLRHRPLQMAHLRRRLRERIAAHQSVAPAYRWMSPLRALAAALLLAGVVAGVVLITRSSAVSPSSTELSLIHRENVSGDEHASIVASMDSAKRLLTQQWKDCPQLPDTPLATVASCHIHRFERKKLACLEVIVDGQSLTLAVAHDGDIRLPETPGSVNRRDGLDYRVESSGGVNIVIVRRDGLWLCLMGELPVERLIAVAASFQA